MKVHSNEFKNIIKKNGRQLDSKITFGSTVLGKDDLNSVTPSFQGSILKSVMKELDIDSNVDIPLNTVLKYEFGVKVNGEYEYINFGNYVVYKSEKQEDTNSYRITCYDKMLYSMKEYEKMNITYPITLRNYINAVCSHLGLTFKDNSGTFANYNRTIQNELYIDKDDNSLGYTFRDVFDELAQATASTICINNNDELEIRYINDTGDTIDEEFLRDVNVNFGEKFGAVNTIVLSRSAESDNVYYPETLPTNPYELKIVDNQIMNGNDRADYLPDIYNKLNGLEFYINDFSSTGICYYELCDRYNVKVGDKTYSCVMFNDEILVTQGLRENVFTDMPKETKTDYTKADKTDRRINQTNLIVDKQNQEIQALVESVKDIEVDTTLTKQASGNPITIEDAGAYPCESFIVEGKSEQETRSGKNILYLNNVSGTKNGIEYTWNGNELILNGTSTASTDIYNFGGWGSTVQNEKRLLKTGTYTFSVQGNNPTGKFNANMYYDTTYIMGTNASTGSTRTITLNSDTYYSNFYITMPNGKTFNNEKFYFQLEKGSTATDYEQYGAMPSPNYPSKIETVKGVENVFDGLVEASGGFSDTTGQPLSGSSRITNVNPIKVEENNKYIFTLNKIAPTELIRYFFYDKDNNFISSVSNQTGKFTTPEKCCYINFHSTTLKTNYGLELPNPMITKENELITYIPFGKYLITRILGKNLYNYIDNFISETYGLTNTLDEDGSITVSGIPTQGYVAITKTIYITDLLEDGEEYTISQTTANSLVWLEIRARDINDNSIKKYYGTQRGSVTFVADKKLYKYDARIICGTVANWGENSRTITNSYQIEKSDKYTGFEKYKKAQFITYDLKKENLLSNNPSDWEQGTTSFVDNGVSTTRIKTKDYIEIDETKKYSMSLDNSNYCFLNIDLYNSNKIGINTYYNAVSSNINGSKNIILTFPSGVKYIKPIIRNVDNVSVMTPDEIINIKPVLYEGTGTNDYYELVSIDDIKDELDEATGVLTKRIGVRKLTASDWQGYANTAQGSLFRSGAISNIPTDSNNLILCDKYKGILGANVRTNNTIYFNIATKTFDLIDNRYTNLEDFKANCGDITVYYVLDEPYTIQLEPTEIELFKGTNNIYTLDDLEPNMNITYLTDTKSNAQYATKSELKVAENSIKASVSGEITELDEKTEALLELKVDKNDNDQIVSMINASAEEINLTANRFSMESDKSRIDKDGTVKFEGGTVGGFDLSKTNFSSDISGIYNYTGYDLRNAIGLIMEFIHNSSIQKDILDIDDNVGLDSLDVVKIQRIIRGDEPSNKVIDAKFKINSQDPKNCVSLIYNGETAVSLGTGGINADVTNTKSLIVSSPSNDNIATYGIYANGETARMIITDNNNTTAITPTGISTNSIYAGNIQTGRCVLNSTNITSVEFDGVFTYEAPPTVIITPSTSVTGVIAPKTTEVTTTGFKATIGGSGIPNVVCHWIAIG